MFDSITCLDEQHREWHERRHHPGGMKSRPYNPTPGRPTARASAKKTSPRRARAPARRPTRDRPASCGARTPPKLWCFSPWSELPPH